MIGKLLVLVGLFVSCYGQYAFLGNDWHNSSLAILNFNPPFKVQAVIDTRDIGIGTFSKPIIVQPSTPGDVAPANPVIIVTAYSKTMGNVLIAFDLQTGFLNWIVPNSCSTGAAFCGVTNRVICVNSNANLVISMAGYDISNGSLAFSTLLPGQYMASSVPATRFGLSYTGLAGSGGTVYCVNNTDGKLLWTGSVMNGDDSSPVIDDAGNVYVSYVGPQTYKFNGTTGKLLWHYAGSSEGGGGATPQLSANGYVWVRSWASTPEGYILSASTGKELGRFSSNYPLAFVPLRLNSTARVFGFVGRNISVYDSLLDVIGSISPPSGYQWGCSSPVVVNNIVYAVASNYNSGFLYGYNINSFQSAFAPVNLTTSAGFSCSNSGELNAGFGYFVVPTSNNLFILQATIGK